MKVQIEIELAPFTVPNFVIAKPVSGFRQDGMKEPQSYPLSALDQDTLYRLCREFTCAVFNKAGVDMPPEQA